MYLWKFNNKILKNLKYNYILFNILLKRIWKKIKIKLKFTAFVVNFRKNLYEKTLCLSYNDNQMLKKF